jgi:hypothetical protein
VSSAPSGGELARMESLAYDQQFSSKLPNDTFLVSGAKHYNIIIFEIFEKTLNAE